MKKNLFLALVIAIVLFTHLEIFFMPVGTDEGIFFHIGQQMAQGHLPYLDVWDHKPPVGWYIFAAVLKFSNTNLALIIFEIIWILLTAWLFYLLAQKFFKEKYAQYATLLFVFAANVHRVAEGGNQLEVYMILFSILLYWLYWLYKEKKKYLYLFLGGICWGLSFQTKPVGIFSGIAVGLFMLIDLLSQKKRDYKHFFKEIFSLALGFVVPTLLLYLYFSSKGIWQEYLACNFGHNFLYISKNIQRKLFITGIWQAFLDQTVSLLFMWLLILYGFFKMIKENKKYNQKILFIGLIFLFDFIGVAMGSKFYGHYFIQLMPAAAIIAVYGWQNIEKEKIWRNIIYVLIGLAVIIQLFFLVKQIYKRYVLYPIDFNKETGLYLQSKTIAKDPIYVQGNVVSIYFHANRPNAWKYEGDHLVGHRGYKFTMASRKLLEKNKPAYVVITDPDHKFPWHADFLRKYYKFDKKIGGNIIYKLRYQ